MLQANYSGLFIPILPPKKTLGNKESKFLEELRQATQQFSFKQYEESFTKIEQDLQDFYQDLTNLRDDFDLVSNEHRQMIEDQISTSRSL